MINVKALQLILLWLIFVNFDQATAFQRNCDLITDDGNPVVKTSSGSVRGITKTVMAAKVDVFLGVTSIKF